MKASTPKRSKIRQPEISILIPSDVQLITMAFITCNIALNNIQKRPIALVREVNISKTFQSSCDRNTKYELNVMWDMWKRKCRFSEAPSPTAPSPSPLHAHMIVVPPPFPPRLPPIPSLPVYPIPHHPENNALTERWENFKHTASKKEVESRQNTLSKR